MILIIILLIITLIILCAYFLNKIKELNNDDPIISTEEVERNKVYYQDAGYTKISIINKITRKSNRVEYKKQIITY